MHFGGGTAFQMGPNARANVPCPVIIRIDNTFVKDKGQAQHLANEIIGRYTSQIAQLLNGARIQASMGDAPLVARQKRVYEDIIIEYVRQGPLEQLHITVRPQQTSGGGKNKKTKGGHFKVKTEFTHYPLGFAIDGNTVGQGLDGTPRYGGTIENAIPGATSTLNEHTGVYHATSPRGYVMWGDSPGPGVDDNGELMADDNTGSQLLRETVGIGLVTHPVSGKVYLEYHIARVPKDRYPSSYQTSQCTAYFFGGITTRDPEDPRKFITTYHFMRGSCDAVFTQDDIAAEDMVMNVTHADPPDYSQRNPPDENQTCFYPSDFDHFWTPMIGLFPEEFLPTDLRDGASPAKYQDYTWCDAPNTSTRMCVVFPTYTLTRNEGQNSFARTEGCGGRSAYKDSLPMYGDAWDQVQTREGPHCIVAITNTYSTTIAGIATGDGSASTGSNYYSGIDFTTLRQDDVIMVAVDTDARKVWFGKNGRWGNDARPAEDRGHHLLLDGDVNTKYYPGVAYFIGPVEVTIMYEKGSLQHDIPEGFKLYGQTVVDA